jgi:transglutaminase-like putative cysteine protease
MLRPREGADLRLLSIEIETFPDSKIDWTQDVFGNAVATAEFFAPSDIVKLESRLDVEIEEDLWPIFNISASAISYPFLYTEDERLDLGILAEQVNRNVGSEITTWANGFVHSDPTDTLSLLKDINTGTCAWVAYESRADEGTQSPMETLSRRVGSCRDLAVLFAATVRCLGFGARIVSGYICPDRENAAQIRGTGSTHAWVEVYVPGAGWITFDPTNQKVGSGHLIPIAVGRKISQVMPVSGNFFGPRNAFLGMNVLVDVRD